ncbi:peptidase m60, enhancin and enhancin-like domain-containing protein [Hirsutella rhossiliensis]
MTLPGNRLETSKDITKYSSTFIEFTQTSQAPGLGKNRGKVEFPLKLTSYVQDSATGKLKESDHQKWQHQWETRAAETYKQSDPSVFPQPRTITVTAVPGAEDERQRLKQQFKWADFQPTGFYLNPNAPLTVSVSGVSGAGRKPEILVGTPALVNPTHLKEVLPTGLDSSGPLGNGNHQVSHPLGGIMYIRYTHAAGQSVPRVTVTLAQGDAAQPFPLYRQGVTTLSLWKKLLSVTKVPFAEHTGKRVIMTGLAAHAKIYADKGLDQDVLLDTYGSIITAQDDISALTSSAPSPRDRPSSLRPIVVQTRTDANPNSSNFRAAVPAGNHKYMYWQNVTRQSWMIWHELGHHRQHSYTWSWRDMTEDTVNIYSLAARRLVPEIPSKVITHGTIKEWEYAKKYLAQDPSMKVFESAGHFVRLVLFEQLRVVFGDAFYHQLHKNSRAGENKKSDADKKHYFMTQAAQLAEENLTDYFTKWGLKPERRTIDEMEKQPDPVEDYTKRPVYGGEKDEARHLELRGV